MGEPIGESNASNQSAFWKRLRVVLQRCVGACLLLPSQVRLSLRTPVTPAVSYLLTPVIRASWPEHPTLIKKKRILKRKRIQTHQYSVVTFWALVITWPDVCMIRSWAMIRYSQASLDLFKGLKTNNHIYIYIYIYKHINTCKSCVKITLSYF